MPQSITHESDSERRNRSQRLYAKTGHSIGHSPEIENLPSSGLSVSQLLAHFATGERLNFDAQMVAVISEFLKGKNPDEIHAEFPDFRLSQVYAIISVYLEREQRNFSLPQLDGRDKGFE